MTRDAAAALAASTPFPGAIGDATRKRLTNETEGAARARVREPVEPFIASVDMLLNLVLVVMYTRPKVTAGGILRTDESQDEDIWQGKAGLVVKLGPTAFMERGEFAFDPTIAIKENDWVFFSPQAGRLIEIGGVKCKVLPDTAIMGRLRQPDVCW